MTKEALIRRYLLGRLAEDERGELEDQYFAKTEAFEEFVAIENDLIDSYVRRELSPSENETFETQYLNLSQRRARVEFARSLDRACRESSARARTKRLGAWRFSLQVFSEAPPALRWASVAAALILTAAGLWLILQNYQLRKQLQEAQKQIHTVEAQLGHRQEPPFRSLAPTLDVRGANRSTNIPQTSDIATLEPSQKAGMTFTLSSETVRGDESTQKDLVIPSNVSSIILRLPLSTDQHVKYQAELQTGEGRRIQSTKGLSSRKSDGKAMVLFRVPCSRLAPGDYIVLLSGTDADGRVEEVETYTFRTVGK